MWLLGGLLSLIGAVCYAELATAYPKEGGDYVYLTRAFGRAVGFLFAWCQLWIVRPGSIGAMAFLFADYANQIWPQAEGPTAACVLVAYAVGSIVAADGGQYARRSRRQMDAERLDRGEGSGPGGHRGGRFQPSGARGGVRAARGVDWSLGFHVRLGDGFRVVRLRRMERNGLRQRGGEEIRERTSFARC